MHTAAAAGWAAAGVTAEAGAVMLPTGPPTPRQPPPPEPLRCGLAGKDPSIRGARLARINECNNREMQ
jgi:hypothetical protein